jgi:hypothetical protein
MEDLMKSALIVTSLIATLSLGACATAGYDENGRYTSACRADYQNNRTAATVGGAAVGAAAGVAIAKDDTAGALIGGAAGAIIGNQVAKRDDPCGDRRGYNDRRY